MVKRKQTKTEKWLSQQHHNVTRLSLVLPTASQYRKMNADDKRVVTRAMRSFKNKSPLNRANSLQDLINTVPNAKTADGHYIVSGRQKGQIYNVSSAMKNLSMERNDITDERINKIAQTVASSPEEENKIVKQLFKTTAGSAYKKRRDIINIRRYEEFKSPKMSKEALSNFNKNEFKQVVEDYIIYSRTYSNSSEVVVVRDSDYYGTYSSVDEAMNMIYDQLSANYNKGDLFAKNLGVVPHGKYAKQTKFVPKVKGRRK